MEREYSTTTKEFGSVTFSAPAATETCAGYVWIEGDAFKERKQICHGGDIAYGNTVQSTTLGLKATAQRWMRDRRAWLRKDGL